MQTALETSCPECNALNPAGRSQCARCGHRGLKMARVGRAREEVSLVVKVYVAVFVGGALLFPFLIPIILKISAANP